MPEHIDRSALPIRRPPFSGIGCDRGLPVDRAYADKSPFAFTGTIENVVFDVDPHLTPEDRQAMHEHEQRAALAHGMGA